jgi:excisionase family DNA binding protein
VLPRALRRGANLVSLVEHSMIDLTPKQVAQAIGVSESSLKRWCDRGLIPVKKTAGGHRRLSIDSVLEFLRANRRPLVRPELLGLPPTTGKSRLGIRRAREEVEAALIDGDEEICRRIVFDLHLSGCPVSVICDETLAEAFRGIGGRWECGKLDIFRERRACEIAVRTLHELRGMIAAPPPERPLAVGGAPEGDIYMLPTVMVELTLRQCGWRAVSLGAKLPFTTLAAAIEALRPQMFWLSVSHVVDQSQFLREQAEFYRVAQGHNVSLVVGGRALTESLRSQMRFSTYCENLRQLESHVRPSNAA